MISLSPVQSLLACCLTLLLGRFLSTRISFLARYCIPDPIIGGLIFATTTYILSKWGNVQISLETTIRPTLLLLFFGCLGLTAKLKLLAKGGSRLVILLLILLPFLVLQNIVGLGLAALLDMHPLMGLIAGTVTLVGGHGTSTAYASRFSDINNIQNIVALAMTSATIGLVLGGTLGGPVAEWLLKRHKIKTPVQNGETAIRTSESVYNENEIHHSEMNKPSSFVNSISAALITLVSGTYLSGLVDQAHINLPNFLLCLASGILIRNIGPSIGFCLDDRVTEIVSAIVLSMFLGLTMMTLDLASAARLAGPLAMMLGVQAIVCVIYCCIVVFRVLKADYEAAAIAGAFCGICLGTTATAIANMQAITKSHGPAPQSFIVVPIAGAFLVDILNVIVLTALISLPFVGGV
ncbi:MAG: sodium/glutamate symporter [Bordetella sp.]|nr:MAG: sodium/glutamate symporter [Bordetella sp.]